ncbi:MAG TPA: isocitrate lyase/phosphoenolpyruvate mutase family protein [Hyphomicrobiaceae bacterium]|nr:isocitrate lyase/phosphoenolpyruvate mutase family protein [Hyphomicrobiaceae bacterium]
MPTQSEKGSQFRALHVRGAAFVIPNPWDPGSAKVLGAHGFVALATTSAGFAFSIGRGDGDVTRDEMLQHCGAICAATDLPVSADLENCYADSPEGVAETVRRAAATGLVGCSIEDYMVAPAPAIYDFELAVARVKAGAEAARSLGFPFTITARAENVLRGKYDLAEAVRRLQAYEAVGADVLYAPGLQTMAQVREVVDAVSRPVNVLATKDLVVGELREAGVARVSLGGALYRTAMTGFFEAVREIRDQGTFKAVGKAPGSGNIAKMVKGGKAE